MYEQASGEVVITPTAYVTRGAHRDRGDIKYYNHKAHNYTKEVVTSAHADKEQQPAPLLQTRRERER